jgi:putative transposase
MEEEKIYHIFNRGNNKENIFLTRENYLFFLRRYKEYLHNYLDTYAYCLMPNHFHFLVKVKEPAPVIETSTSKNLKTIEVLSPKLTPLEKALKDFFISYSKAFNNANDRTGSLFQYKFKRKLIDNDSYYSAITAYIHLNPVKAKLCESPEDWEFSSYKAYLGSKPTSLKRGEVLEWFGGMNGFKEFHSSYQSFSGIDKYLF